MQTLAECNNKPHATTTIAMAKIKRLREQIDACRPGTADLSLAALAELAAEVKHDREVADELSRTNAFDRAVTEALHDAPVPAGLADRLMVAVQAEAVPKVGLVERFPSDESVGAGRPRFGRRRWWAASGAVALAALLAAVALPLMRPRPEVVQDELGLDVAGWLSNLPANKWQSVATVALPKESELDPAVNGKALRWQSFPTRGNRGWSGTVTAIELRSADQPRAILFVVRSSARFGVSATPSAARPLMLSRGYAATAWQRQHRGMLFVLVVEEDRGQQLEDFLRKRTQA
jgi:hypothetical protein